MIKMREFQGDNREDEKDKIMMIVESKMPIQIPAKECYNHVKPTSNANNVFEFLGILFLKHRTSLSPPCHD